MERVTSYSQENEDIILYNLLKGVDNIRWIDIGANDPINLSVTKFFSLRGGSGINIEPQIQYVRRLKRDRPRDINLAVGVSNKEDKLKMYGRGVGASLDTSLETIKMWGACYEISVVTLKSICEKYVPIGQEIHFLKIDVEGWEKECLEGADFTRWRPWIICVEAEEPGTNEPRWKEWEGILLNYGYFFVGSSLPNRYYVSKEHSDIKDNFIDSDEIKKSYEVIQYKYSEKEEKKMRKRDGITFLVSHPIASLKVLARKLRKRD